MLEAHSQAGETKTRLVFRPLTELHLEVCNQPCCQRHIQPHLPCLRSMLPGTGTNRRNLAGARRRKRWSEVRSLLRKVRRERNFGESCESMKKAPGPTARLDVAHGEQPRETKSMPQCPAFYRRHGAVQMSSMSCAAQVEKNLASTEY